MIFYLFFLICSVSAFASHTFNEIWAYLMEGEENRLKGDEPITDLVYFCARINPVGHLQSVPDRSKLSGKQRVHLVVADAHNPSQLYWILTRDRETRQMLINEIVQAVRPFDGVNIDFEGIRPDDRESYLSFLRDLRAQLPREKMLTVAVMARTAQKNDAFDYPQIAAIADRVFIMAYDEHWSTSSPGEIASLAWCQRVAKYAKKTIPASKLIMGLPLYGRVWQDEAVARALTYPKTLELLRDVAATVMRKPDGTGFFSYQKTVTATAFFEDMHSLSSKLEAYESSGVKAVGFWRVGQGPAALWSNLAVFKR